MRSGYQVLAEDAADSVPGAEEQNPAGPASRHKPLLSRPFLPGDERACPHTYLVSDAAENCHRRVSVGRAGCGRVLEAAVEDGEESGAARVVGADRAAAREGDGRGGAGAEAGRHHVRRLERRHTVRPAATAAGRQGGGNIVASTDIERLTSASSDHGRASAANGLARRAPTME